LPKEYDVALATTRRIAEAIVKTLDREYPAITLRELAEAAITAPSTFRMWCEAVGIRARDGLCFARGLWAVYWARRLNAAPHDLLQFAEKRTVQRYLLRSGPLGDRLNAVSVDAFCVRQTFLAHEQILAHVRRLIAEREGKAETPHRT
jgi:hypothetical protein